MENPDPEILENLQQMQHRPINLNEASSVELDRFPLLTRAQILKIISVRQQQPFKNWTDFQNRAELNGELTAWMRLYFTILKKPSKNHPDLKMKWRQRFQRKFPKSRGFVSGDYPGSIWKQNHRFEFQFRQFQGGLLFEKDPGEIHWNDHHAAFFSIHALSSRLKIIMGNYRIHAGQSLVLWGPYGIGKSTSFTAMVPKNRDSLRGYLNTDENNFFRGIAVQYTKSRITASVFCSETPKDARKDSTIQSFPVSGYHRTETERSHQKKTREQMAGGRIACRCAGMTIGFTGWCSRYSDPVAEPDPVRQKFHFQGRKNAAIGFDCHAQVAGCRLAGELAKSESGGYALISHLFWQNRTMQWLLLYRCFSPNFQNPHARGFGYAEASNEGGYFIGGRIKGLLKTRLCFYLDLSRTPWRTYYHPMPEVKSDFLIQVERSFGSGCAVSLKYRYRMDSETAEGVACIGRTITTLQDRIRKQVRFDVHIEPEASCRLRSRIEWMGFSCPSQDGVITLEPRHETGFLCFQEIRFQARKLATVMARWTSFDTDSYDSRIYMFETDLPGILNNRPFCHSGSRWSLLVRVQPRSWLCLSIKYGITWLDNQSSIGTGLDEISGDHVKDLNLQIDIQ